MLGGNGNVSSEKTNFPLGDSKSFSITTVPKVGFFPVDRFATGIFLDYRYTTNRANNIKSSYSYVGVGPFIRYYFLGQERRGNIVAEGSFGYYSQKNNLVTNPSSFISYGVQAGPVIFFNSCVAAELLIGYKGYSEGKTSTKNNGVHLNIGFQIYLEKEK